MSFVFRTQPFYNLLAFYFRAQIRTGQKYSHPSYSLKFFSLFVKVTTETSGSFKDSSPELIKELKRSFTKMSDCEERKDELKKRLTPLQYHVTQEKGTERYNNNVSVIAIFLLN